jgi:hypothetical protein
MKRTHWGEGKDEYVQDPRIAWWRYTRRSHRAKQPDNQQPNQQNCQVQTVSPNK